MHQLHQRHGNLLENRSMSHLVALNWMLESTNFAHSQPHNNSNTHSYTYLCQKTLLLSFCWSIPAAFKPCPHVWQHGRCSFPSPESTANSFCLQNFLEIHLLPLPHSRLNPNYYPFMILHAYDHRSDDWVSSPCSQRQSNHHRCPLLLAVLPISENAYSSICLKFFDCRPMFLLLPC